MNNTINEMESISTSSRKNIEEKFCDFLRKWPQSHKLYCKYEEILVYLVIGALTTIVAWAAKFACNYIFFNNSYYPTGSQNAILSTVSWVAGVMFAYPTNRIYVFKSHNPIFKEAIKFAISRVSTWILDIIMMYFLSNICKINLFISTVIVSIFVMIGNYVFSKLAVFNRQHK